MKIIHVNYDIFADGIVSTPLAAWGAGNFQKFSVRREGLQNYLSTQGEGAAGPLG